MAELTDLAVKDLELDTFISQIARGRPSCETKCIMLRHESNSNVASG